MDVAIVTVFGIGLAPIPTTFKMVWSSFLALVSWNEAKVDFDFSMRTQKLTTLIAL
jgi:hypothetical protein